jgi:hypothetical protein
MRWSKRRGHDASDDGPSRDVVCLKDLTESRHAGSSRLASGWSQIGMPGIVGGPSLAKEVTSHGSSGATVSLEQLNGLQDYHDWLHARATEEAEEVSHDEGPDAGGDAP